MRHICFRIPKNLGGLSAAFLVAFAASACSPDSGAPAGSGRPELGNAGVGGQVLGSGGAAPVGSNGGAGGTGPVFGDGSVATAGSGGGVGDGGFTKCTGLAVGSEQVVQSGPLDIYLVFDRTGSMGQDCDFTPGTSPPVSSKACFATYAIAQYFMSVDPASDTRLAFQFMSLAADDCNGVPYATPLIDMTPLPVDANHALVQSISNESFQGGLGTHIEGAIRGISDYTIQHHQTVGAPAGRTTIGVLMTDGDPNGCDQDIANLTQLVTTHFAASGGAVKMFFIGETGATLGNLEQYAAPGGAAPHADFCGNGPNPCHYWDVGDGNAAAFASAMASIVGQATVSKPIPCTFVVPSPPTGQTLDPSLVNVRFTDPSGQPSTIYKVDSAASCDPALGGWYYDDPATPHQILLCDSSCSVVGSSAGANLEVELGCASETPPVH